jgi:Immunity protein 70
MGAAMARVDLYVNNSMWTVGEDWFLHSFFSTIAYRLEPNGWGSRFPALMMDLYTSEISADVMIRPFAREGTHDVFVTGE